MNEFLTQIDPSSALLGAALGGLLIAGLAALMWRSWKSSATREAELAQLQLSNDLAEREAAAEALREELAAREGELHSVNAAFNDTRQSLAVVQTRLEEQQTHFHKERDSLVAAEKRLEESFERLAGRVFDERSKRFTELSEKQLEGLLKPLSKDLEGFRSRVDETHSEEIKQHAALREKLEQLEGLNKSLNKEAHNLTRALTGDVKAQGGWGEQQLERLLELAGLQKGDNYQTQFSVQGRNGELLRPDLVLLLPEGRTIVMDSKVSLTAWTRFQAAEEEGEQERALNEHVKSVRAHIDGLARKNYTDAEALNALDFVLMFVPIEAALIAALHADPTLPEYALKKRIALLSPANFLATVRTVASVWMIHKQNVHARDIAQRAGSLYDKFVGFTESLTQVGARLDQAQNAYGTALKQLSTGSGNLVRQTEMLSKLGAKHAKQLEENLLERAGTEEPAEDAASEEERTLKLVKPDADSTD